MAKVEIVLATFNGGRFLEEQLDSLINQSYKDIRVTIRDDGSKDETLGIINGFCRKYPETVFLSISSGIPLGSSLSFSKLLEESSGKYIMLCDQDDVWKETKVEMTFKEMKRIESLYGNEMPLLVFTDLVEVDEQLNVISPSFFSSQKLFPEISSNATKLAALNVVAGCTVMINRAALKISLPVPSSKIVHDQWLAVNVAHFGKVSYLREGTLLYRQHSQNSIGSKDVGFNYFMRKIFQPLKQFGIYMELLRNLKFRLNWHTFLYFKFLFTIKRIL